MISPKSFRDRLKEARPDVVQRQKDNSLKANIAMKLRGLRDARGMTQADVAKASGMTASAIMRLEALTGPVPRLESIERYVEACAGHMALMISAEEIKFADPERPDRHL